MFCFSLGIFSGIKLKKLMKQIYPTDKELYNSKRKLSFSCEEKPFRINKSKKIKKNRSKSNKLNEINKNALEEYIFEEVKIINSENKII